MSNIDQTLTNGAQANVAAIGLALEVDETAGLVGAGAGLLEGRRHGRDVEHAAARGDELAIGNGGALYVSLDNGLTASYRDATATYIWAYRTVRLSAGEYTVDYDWLIDPATRNNTQKCMRVGILPVSVTFTDASNMVTMADGTAYSITRTQQPPEWIRV